MQFDSDELEYIYYSVLNTKETHEEDIEGWYTDDTVCVGEIQEIEGMIEMYEKLLDKIKTMTKKIRYKERRIK